MLNYLSILLRPTLYIALIAERRSMKIGVPGRRESRMFCKQVWIELSAESDVLGPELYYIQIKSSVLNNSVLYSFTPRASRPRVSAWFSKNGNSTPGRNNINRLERIVKTQKIFSRIIRRKMLCTKSHVRIMTQLM